MNKVQQGKIAICEECKRRRVQNENIVTCKSATWNKAIHKKSASQKKCNMKTLLHKKLQKMAVCWRTVIHWSFCGQQIETCIANIWDLRFSNAYMSETYWRSFKTSKMEGFAKLFNGWKPTRNTLLYVLYTKCQCSELLWTKTITNFLTKDDLIRVVVCRMCML